MVPAGARRRTLSRPATAGSAINRRDYGLTCNQALETGGVLVGNEARNFLEI